MQRPKVLGYLFEVGFVGCNFLGAFGLQQGAHFLVEIAGQALELFLALTAFCFKPLPFPRLWQTVPAAAEQLGWPAEKATAGEDLL